MITDCNKLTQQYNAASTRADYDRWKEARGLHHEEIALYRGHYQADQLKSRSDSSFVCIGIDGSDQATTYCPQIWSSHLHGDMPENSYIQQKVMGVVVHGAPDETIFYVTDPRVPHGMDLTTNCLLDALTNHTDLRASTLRIQFDGSFFPSKKSSELSTGSSENVNYAVHCLCALLVDVGIFEHVYTNRFPPGFENQWLVLI